MEKNAYHWRLLKKAWLTQNVKQKNLIKQVQNDPEEPIWVAVTQKVPSNTSDYFEYEHLASLEPHLPAAWRQHF